MIIGIVFLFALVIGSFLNVCIHRIPNGGSISFPPSHCPNCKANLKPVDLIPVLSYVFLRGRCKYCKSKISIRYPLVELLNGLAWVFLYFQYGYSTLFLGYGVLCSTLIVISMIDLDTTEIPDGLNLFAFLTAIIFIVLQWNLKISENAFWGGLIGAGSFYFIAVVSKGGMGGGDIKLMGALGIWLGWKLILIQMLLSFVIGAIVSIGLITLKIKGRKDFVPFGPFIAISAYITLVWGAELIHIYMKLLF